MLVLYVSTSRKPTQQTRILAKWLARLFGGESENRGKRSVSDIASRMEAKGFAKAVFVYEKHGSPYSLNFFDAEQGWLYPEILVGGFEFPPKEGKRLSPVTSAEAADAEGERILEMIGFENAEVDDGLKLHAGSKEMAFYDGKTKVFSLKIKGFRQEKGEKEEEG